MPIVELDVLKKQHEKDPVKVKSPHFAYDKGQDRHRHDWNKDRAGVVFNSRPIGKCPNNISKAKCEELLNSGIAIYDSESLIPEIPSEIWTVYQGVIYYATPSEAGKSFHAFPVRKIDMKEIEQIIQRRASDEGTLKILKKWKKADYDTI